MPKEILNVIIFPIGNRILDLLEFKKEQMDTSIVNCLIVICKKSPAYSQWQTEPQIFQVKLIN